MNEWQAGWLAGWLVNAISLISFEMLLEFCILFYLSFLVSLPFPYHFCRSPSL